jgi:hypothetical protein
MNSLADSDKINVHDTITNHWSEQKKNTIYLIAVSL